MLQRRKHRGHGYGYDILATFGTTPDGRTVNIPADRIVGLNVVLSPTAGISRDTNPEARLNGEEEDTATRAAAATLRHLGITDVRTTITKRPVNYDVSFLDKATTEAAIRATAAAAEQDITDEDLDSLFHQVTGTIPTGTRPGAHVVNSDGTIGAQLNWTHCYAVTLEPTKPHNNPLELPTSSLEELLKATTQDDFHRATQPLLDKHADTNAAAREAWKFLTDNPIDNALTLPTPTGGVVVCFPRTNTGREQALTTSKFLGQELEGLQVRTTRDRIR